MKKEKLKLINYLGSKFKFTEIINSKFAGSDNDYWLEPFLGSGVVFLNTEKEYEHYFINDIEKKVVLMMNSFKNCSYKEYLDFLKMIQSNFGILMIQEDYRSFRKYFNENLFNTGTIEEGLAIYALCNSSFSSLMKFSRNGFSVASGERMHQIIEPETFSRIQSKLNRTTITSNNFNNVLDIDDIENMDVFLDPPYLNSKYFYKKDTTKLLEDYNVFINQLMSQENKVVGTDTECILSSFDFDVDYEILRKMNSPVPYITNVKMQNEIIFEVK